MQDFNKNYFERNQKTLLYIANHWWSRWILGLHRIDKKLKGHKIIKINTSSFFYEAKNKQTTGIFYTRPRFAEALAYNLSPLAYLQNANQTGFRFRFSPVGTLAMLLLGVPR